MNSLVKSPSFSKELSFTDLGSADLIVDAVYKGGTFGNLKDDPLSRLMGCGNQGGFRHVGSYKTQKFKLAVLYSSLTEPDWPDQLDLETGLFVYYGDNRSPGHELHDTPHNGTSYCASVLTQSTVTHRKETNHRRFSCLPKE